MKCGWKNYLGNVCDGELKLSKADLPWHDEHYYCPICDSTYYIGTIIEREREKRENKIDDIIGS